MVGLHMDDDIVDGTLESPIYADDKVDPTWMLQEVNNGKYLIKPKATTNILAGTHSRDLFAFRQEKCTAPPGEGPCFWTITETANKGIFEITREDSLDGWTVRNEKINVTPLNYSDKNKFVITPDVGVFENKEDEELESPESPLYDTNYDITNY
ncbi:hypothetical protein H072_5938 [Dactylellina haptotyla CBS 200.50]|uniref:Ricin B lectin domain-containing protein n=1 Tax=Dactylellina haptotyla (strain CBS 200.50) TaxID=1284197 RepID=S8ABC4_DACHA|nr:hypothetical protein H072_5938 [Dactylellina haptotyla CBS 200.50]